MPINAELFRAIADVLERKPAIYNQGVWCSGIQDDDDVSLVPFVDPNAIGECGTVGCIAGLASMLTPIEQRVGESIQDVGQNALAISDREASYLFSGGWKPREGVAIPQELRRIAETGIVFEVISDDGHSAELNASGDYAELNASGHSAKLNASGHSAKLNASGDYAELNASGHSAKLNASGDYAELNASGHYAELNASGDYAKVCVGEKGVFVLWTLANGNRRPVVGVIGETLDNEGNVLLPKQFYRLNRDGKIQKV